MEGTAAAPVVFTERQDDVKNDTNNDGTATTPSWDRWGRIEIRPAGSATFDYTQIRYGGYSSPGEVFVDGGSLTLLNSEVRNSRSAGVRIQSSDAVLTNNSYTNSYWAAVSMDLASNPQIAGVDVDKNGINGLYVDGGELRKNLSWNDPDIVYWLGGDITVPAGKTLTITAGQVVKFGSYHHDLFVAGTLNAQGTAVAPVVFTERQDDVKNDTNNDGTATTPNWDQLGPDRDPADGQRDFRLHANPLRRLQLARRGLCRWRPPDAPQQRSTLLALQRRAHPEQ